MGGQEWLLSLACVLVVTSTLGQYGPRTPTFTRIDDSCLEYEDFGSRSPFTFNVRNHRDADKQWVETTREYAIDARSERRPLDLSYLYRKLYRYVTGANVRGQNIQVVEPDCSPRGVYYYRNITLPVVLKLKHRDEWAQVGRNNVVNVTMMMRVDMPSAPRPTDDDVIRVDMPRSFFIRPFRLRTKDVDPAQMASNAGYMKCELRYAHFGFNTTTFYVASYEGRFATMSRRPYLHHVMIEATPPLLTFDSAGWMHP